jgi:hypothetical protein
MGHLGGGTERDVCISTLYATLTSTLGLPDCHAKQDTTSALARVYRNILVRPPLPPFDLQILMNL